MPIKFYGYNKCSTCVNAKKYFDKKGVKYSEADITLIPPAKSTLKSILKAGNYSIKDLFNKSGVLYREMKMKDKVGRLSESELLDLLAKHGKLVKRPIITDGKRHSVGFKQEQIKQIWGV